jgi:hypothetical protein
MNYIDRAITKYADLVAPIGYSTVRQDALLHLDKYSAIAEVKALVDWVTPYIGKVYEKAGKIIPATEVVSVGIEHFDSATSMAKLAAKDPEHFKFVVGMMRK